MYNLHRAVYTIHCGVQCIRYTVHWSAVHKVHCTLSSKVQCTLYIILCTLYNMVTVVQIKHAQFFGLMTSSLGLIQVWDGGRGQC